MGQWLAGWKRWHIGPKGEDLEQEGGMETRMVVNVGLSVEEIRQ